MLMGIDLGAKTGVAFFDRDTQKLLYTEGISVKSFEDFKLKLSTLYSKYPETTTIVFEVPPFCNNVLVFKKLVYYEYYLKEFFLEKCTVIPVTVGEWKKAFVGKGNAKKIVVAEAVKEKYNIEPSQDICDAIGIGSSFFKLNFKIK